MISSLRAALFSLLTLSASALPLATYVQAADWAVIVAGSAGFDNYRHQADACHAYHVVRSGGIPDSNIIVMMQDDIASDPSNPYPGKIFNRPTATGTPGVDVYTGCKKDYTGATVTPANFLAVLTGDSKTTGGKPVLASTTSDRVFVNFIDHGATGLVAFPDGSYLYAADLNTALQTANKKGLFGKLVFYMEACESGSMFDGILANNTNIYATTASNPDESSWGTYCAGETPGDIVNGVEIGSCLGDLYSVNWMEDADKAGMQQTLKQQFDIVVNLTVQSHVMAYGDVSYTTLPIGDFEGNGADATNNHIRISGMTLGGSHPKPVNHVNSRDIGLHNAFYSYKRSSTRSNQRKQSLLKLQHEVALRIEADELFDVLSEQFVHAIAATTNTKLEAAYLFGPAKMPVLCNQCCKSIDAAIKNSCGGFNDYSLQYHRIVVNACEAGQHGEEVTQLMVKLVQATCAKKPMLIQM